MRFHSVARLLVFSAAIVLAVEAANYCCSPDQYEILAGQVNGLVLPTGQGLAQMNGLAMAADFTNMRVGEEIESTAAGHTTKLKVIIDFKKNYTYTIIGQTCTKGPAKGDFIQCIPKTAKYTGSFYVGNNKLLLDAYSYYANIPGVISGNTTMEVTHEGCIPFGTTIIGQTLSTSPPMPILSVTGFVNYTEGIKDPGRWFDIPSFCPQLESAFQSKPMTIRPKRYVETEDESSNAAIQLMSIFNAVMAPSLRQL